MKRPKRRSSFNTQGILGGDADHHKRGLLQRIEALPVLDDLECGDLSPPLDFASHTLKRPGSLLRSSLLSPRSLICLPPALPTPASCPQRA